MSPTKRDRTTHPSSSPESHTEKRCRVEEEDTGERSSQSLGEAPMDIASSSGSEPDMSTIARSSSNSLIDQRPPVPLENETSEIDSATALTADDGPEDHDQTEDDRDNEENNNDDMGVVSWGWGDAHFLYELHPRRSARNEPQPETSYSDPRILLWQQEYRGFAGEIFQDNPEIAAPVALSASHGPLEVDGVPHLSIFCDGSIRNTRGQLWKKGGYGVAFRDPFLGTTPFASQTNPARFVGEPTVHEHQQTFGTEPLEDGGFRDGLAKVDDFTILEHGTEALCVPHVELAAISQSLEVSIRLRDQHQPQSMKISIFSDSTPAIERLQFGILPLDSDEESLFRWFTNPLVRTIVWQSHYLYDRGCSLEIRWHPRCCALGPVLADAAASSWKAWGRNRFCQADLPAEDRDGILEKLHQWTDDVINWEPEEQPEESLWERD